MTSDHGETTLTDYLAIHKAGVEAAKAATAGMNNQPVRDFAARLTALGFRVYIAQDGAGRYGFITDAEGARVLSFSFNDGGSLSGNYGPPSTESGTGWRMDEAPHDLRTADDIRRALNAHPPSFCGRGWRYLTTVAQHLATYHPSSLYAEFHPAA